MAQVKNLNFSVFFWPPDARFKVYNFRAARLGVMFWASSKMGTTLQWVEISCFCRHFSTVTRARGLHSYSSLSSRMSRGRVSTVLKARKNSDVFSNSTSNDGKGPELVWAVLSCNFSASLLCHFLHTSIARCCRPTLPWTMFGGRAETTPNWTDNQDRRVRQVSCDQLNNSRASLLYHFLYIVTACHSRHVLGKREGRMWRYSNSTNNDGSVKRKAGVD